MVGHRGGLTEAVRGDNATFAVEPMKPVAIEVRSRFVIHEGNRTVGAGIVTRLLA